MAEKGFTNAEVSHTITPVAGGPKLVNVTFLVNEGPKIKIRSIDFVGNEAIGDGTLQRKLKENKPKGIISFITGSGTYKESEYEADVERVVEYYQNKGYVRARVGQPELKTLENTKDGKTRWIQLRIPVTEGPRYRIGELGLLGEHAGEERGAAAALRAREGRVVQPQEARGRPPEVAGDLRRRRLHGVHGVSRTSRSATIRPSRTRWRRRSPSRCAPPPEAAQAPSRCRWPT